MNVSHIYREITHVKWFLLPLVQHDKELNHSVLSERVDQYIWANAHLTTTSIYHSQYVLSFWGGLSRYNVHSQGHMTCGK